MRCTHRVVLIAVSSAAASALPAQTTGQIAVVSGSGTDQRGVRSSALTIAPSLRLTPDPRVAVTLFGAATQFEDQVRSIAGGGSLAATVPLAGGFSLVSSAQGSVAETSFDAQFASGEVTGAVELAVGAVAFSGGVLVAHGATRFRDAVVQPGLPGFSRDVTRSRHGVGPIAAAQWRVTGAARPAQLQLFARVQSPTIDGIEVRDASVGAAALVGPLTLQGSVGQRQARDERATFAAAAGSLRLSRTLAVDVSGGRYPTDRISGAMGGQYLNAGLSLRFGGPAVPKVLRVPGMPAPRDGTTRLVIRARDARQVEVAGDWNAWQRIPAQQGPDGLWYVDVSLSPGEYRYTFLINGTEWRVPAEAVATADGFGGQVAWVTVRDRRR